MNIHIKLVRGGPMFPREIFSVFLRYYIKQHPDKVALVYRTLISQTPKQLVPSNQVKVSSRNKPWFNILPKSQQGLKKMGKQDKSTLNGRERALSL